jgi:hypothetical protein
MGREEAIREILECTGLIVCNHPEKGKCDKCDIERYPLRDPAAWDRAFSRWSEETDIRDE